MSTILYNMDIIYIPYSALDAPHRDRSSPVEKVALFTFRFKCLALIHSFLQVSQFLSFGSSVFIIIMPRVKPAPKKNPKDLPNPTNWASVLRSNHCKYFYTKFCGSMRRFGELRRSNGRIWRRTV